MLPSQYCSELPWWKPGCGRRFAPNYDTSTSTSLDFDLSWCVVYRYLSCHIYPPSSTLKVCESRDDRRDSGMSTGAVLAFSFTYNSLCFPFWAWLPHSACEILPERCWYAPAPHRLVYRSYFDWSFFRERFRLRMLPIRRVPGQMVVSGKYYWHGGVFYLFHFLQSLISSSLLRVLRT